MPLTYPNYYVIQSTCTRVDTQNFTSTANGNERGEILYGGCIADKTLSSFKVQGYYGGNWFTIGY